MSTKEITVVTINYRRPDLTLQCVESVLADKAENLQVVVVDNYSNDGSVERIETAIKSAAWNRVSLLKSSRNGGFSAGNNQGLQARDSDYYLLLNNDTIVRPGAINVLRDSLDAHPDIGFACPQLENEDGTPHENCFRFLRPPYEIISASGTGLVARLLPNYVAAIPVQTETFSPEWASFACIMVRRSVFEDIGYLNERFFMYFEDTDFCYRASKAGWKIRFEPGARVAHLRGKSSPVKSIIARKSRLPRYYYESRTYYYYRNFGYPGLLAANLLWQLGWTTAIVRSLFDRRFSVPTCERQWLDIWTNFLKPDADYVHPDNYQ